MTTKVTGSLVLSQDHSDSECSVLTHFSISLARKYVNLKELYKKDIKYYVTTIIKKKKEDRIYMKSPYPEAKCAKDLFKFNPLFVMLTFQIIYQ